MRKGQITQLFSVLLLMLLVVGVAVFVFPMREKVAGLKVERDAISDQLQGLQSELDSLTALSEDVAKSEATKDALLASVPSGYSQDGLILELSEMSEDLSFDLNAMNFSQSVSQDYGNTVTVAANFSGSYDDLIDFLQKLEIASRLMRVTSLSVQLTSTESVVFNLNIEAYYQ
jgi:Tfp pilus assembly protein PilO